MNIDFDKMGGLVPAIIQDSYTSKVLMLGFMNAEALQKTQELGKVTFFSRTKNRLWTKGEESGNFLLVDSIKEDCDRDTLLIKVRPVGPVCHTGRILSIVASKKCLKAHTRHLYLIKVLIVWLKKWGKKL